MPQTLTYSHPDTYPKLVYTISPFTETPGIVNVLIGYFLCWYIGQHLTPDGHLQAEALDECLYFLESFLARGPDTGHFASHAKLPVFFLRQFVVRKNAHLFHTDFLSQSAELRQVFPGIIETGD